MKKFVLSLCAVVMTAVSVQAGGPLRNFFNRQGSVQQRVREAAYPDPVIGTVDTSKAVDGLDEVNAKRAARGLPAFIRDDTLTQGAMACAAFRAAYRIEGHIMRGAGDFALVPGGAGSASATGCAAATPSWGWLSCCTYDNYKYAGAAWVMGTDGQRYMELVVRRK